MMAANMAPGGHSVLAGRPGVRVLVYLCLLGTALGAVHFSDRFLDATGGPDVPPSDAGGVFALQKAGVLYQRLEPGHTPRFIVERHAIPATTAGTARVPAHDEWIVQGKDGNGD